MRRNGREPSDSDTTTLPFRANSMCQSFTSVPRTYIRTADELEPLSPQARLGSFPSLSSPPGRAHSPLYQLQQQQGGRLKQRNLSLPPKPLPPVLAKSLRPSKTLPPSNSSILKNLDEMPNLEAEKQGPATGLLSKCVLCLLLNAVFVLALFLAFLIGHFAAEAHLSSGNKSNASSAVSPISPVALPTFPSPTPPALGSTRQTDHLQEMEFRKNVEKSRQRVPSLAEVYPPRLDADPEPWEEEEDQLLLAFATPNGNGPTIHRSSGAPRPDQPLIPLPRTATPKHYDVNLDLTEFYGVVEPPQIRGNLSILLESFGNATDDELVFHAAANIFIQRIRLYRSTETGKAPTEIRSVKRHTEKEMVRLVLGERLKAGWYWLEMEFRTRICQSEAEGTHCFPAPSVHASSEAQSPRPKRPLVAGFSTKFEPNYARTFLPGWDEPRFRSTFNVTVRHFSDAKVLTNSAELPSDGTGDSPLGSAFVRITRFATTPSMPLYLLAFATGPFTPLEVRPSRGNIPITVWAAPQDMFSANFVANFSPTMFDRLEEDFAVKYPLSKMDIFLTPRLPVGGMENWGLVVLRADIVRLTAADGALPLSMDSSSSSREEQHRERQQQSLIVVDRLAEQYRVEKAIAHELIHQWFGNLVSIWDWEELWMSEGFATYFVFDFLNQAHHLHLTEHEYYLRLIELVNRQSADGRSALVRPLRSARQLDRLFDGVQLYTKGAVLVKMLKDLVGPAEFRAGITRFLRENNFQSVDRRVLFAAFPTHADHGVDPVRLRDAMEPWLLNRGVPEVEVTRSYEDQSIRLEQRQSDQNRHMVFLNDEAMQQMRLEMDDGDKKARRRRKRGTEDDDEEAPGEIYSEREQKRAKSQPERDIDGILEWMEEEMDAIVQGNQTLSTTASAIRTTRSSSTSPLKAFDANAPFGSESERKILLTGRKGRDPERRRNNKHHGHHRQKGGEKHAKKKHKSSSTGNDRPVFTAWRRPHGRDEANNGGGNGVENNGSTSGGRLRFLSGAGDEQKRRTSRDWAQREWGKLLGPLWPVPFSYAFGSVRSARGQTVRQFWLLNDTVRFVDVGLERGQHLLANPHWVYPYRVKYDTKNWQMLIEQLHKNHPEIPVMSRLQLIVDGETFLRHSANPQLFVHMLGYLANEDDLGVLLVGLDALHSLLELFSASEVFGPLITHFLPVIRQLDRQLALTAAEGADPELAALWLLSPLRLSKLYQMRCAANLGTCAESRQVRKWLAYPTALAADNHQQLAALCQHLFQHAGPAEVSLLSGLLRQPTQLGAPSTPFITVIRQLSSTCVQDEALVRQAVAEILRTRNAVLYSAALNSGYTVHYNRKFRELFWTGLAQQLNIHERQILFAMNTGKSDRMARILLHSIRSLGELNLVERVLLQQWPDSLRVEMDYLRRKFSWAEREASEQIRKYLVHGTALKLGARRR